MSQTLSTHDVCLHMVRTHDHARYLTTLHASAVDRPKLWALHAFNIELSRVRESVSEPMIGEIRLAWWQETLESLYGGHARQHPVAEALMQLREVVPKAILAEMIDGRATDLADGHLADFEALVHYASQTGGAQQVAVGHIHGAEAASVHAAMRDIGTAWSLVGIVRAIEFHRHLQRVYLPEAELRALGLDPESLFQRPIGPEIMPLVRRICAHAGQLLGQARRAYRRDMRPAFLLAVLCQDYLLRLHRAGHDVTRADLMAGDVSRQLKLIWSSLTGRC